tara:strand:- start:2706 stop:3074 length:369 start_codon:yes stop_codon:yes gene_type:complete
MKFFETLDESTFTIFAAHHYQNPTCIDADEFYEDIKRFKYIKRLVNRHLEGGKLSVHLILNHLIVVFNVFGNGAGLKMLEYKLEERHWSTIKPFIIYLRIVTNEKYTGVEMDAEVVEGLRKI